MQRITARGLSIGANMSRLLAKIVMLRLSEAYETNNAVTPNAVLEEIDQQLM